MIQLQSKMKKLLVANKRLGTHHQRLNSYRPKLHVPPLPESANLILSSLSSSSQKSMKQIEQYLEMCSYVQKRESNFDDKKSTHQDWLDLPTSFPYSNAASNETKDDINREISHELQKMNILRRLSRYYHNKQHDLNQQEEETQEIQETDEIQETEEIQEILDMQIVQPIPLLCILDAPNFGTTNTLLTNCKGLKRYQSHIIIPQGDVEHYFQMISDQQNGHMINIRCQRLDHWLCTNIGFKHILMYMDYECTFVGNGSSRVSPMLDIQRWFRWNYPLVSNTCNDNGCLLVLTVKLRGSHFTSKLEYIDSFVIIEGKLNGYTVERVNKFAKSLTTLFYKVS